MEPMKLYRILREHTNKISSLTQALYKEEKSAEAVAQEAGQMIETLQQELAKN